MVLDLVCQFPNAPGKQGTRAQYLQIADHVEAGSRARKPVLPVPPTLMWVGVGFATAAAGLPPLPM